MYDVLGSTRTGGDVCQPLESRVRRARSTPSSRRWPAPTANSGDFRPELKDAFSVYKGLLLSKHRPQVRAVGELADFVEVLRGVGKASLYSDEEWIRFFMSVKRIDQEEARDLWDALVCQPEY